MITADKNLKKTLIYYSRKNLEFEKLIDQYKTDKNVTVDDDLKNLNDLTSMIASISKMFNVKSPNYWQINDSINKFKSSIEHATQALESEIHTIEIMKTKLKNARISANAMADKAKRAIDLVSGYNREYSSLW